jgi:hypothetical protein
MIKKLVVGIFAIALTTFTVHAGGAKTRFHPESGDRPGDLKNRNTINALDSTPASDNSANAAYSDGWQNGDNGGTGFGAWTLTDGDGGHYVGATGLGASTFGLFNTFTATTTDAVRPFTGGPLAAGQTFSIDLGFTTFAAAGSVGLNLRSGTTESLTLATDGANWMLNDGGLGGAFNIGTATANTPYHFALTYNGGNSYSFTLTGATPGDNFVATNNLTGIDNVRFFNFNQGGGANFGFDNLSITTAVPEPTTLSLLAGPVLLGGYFFLRRRRAS